MDNKQSRERRLNGQTFPEIADRYRGLLNSMTEKYARLAGMNSHDEEDLRQEALIALYSAYLTYKTDQDGVTFGLYAKVCIRNRLAGVLRKRHINENSIDRVFSDTVDPESEFISKEEYEALLSVIDGLLTDYEKSVFKLYLRDLSYREIAGKLGKNEKSVDNAICRIKTKIKKIYN